MKKLGLCAFVLGGLIAASSCSDDGEMTAAVSSTTSDSSSGSGGSSTSGGGAGGETSAGGGGTGPSAIGEPCEPGMPPDLQGTCPDGTACFPTPGGYCTSPCLFADCPADATCVASPKDGELCARTCETDADCRSAEGYVCDPDWKACVQWLLSPILATCPSAPPLPRTTFGPVTQLSTSAGPGKYHMEPAAGLDAQGNVTAVFMARNDFFEDGALGVSTLLANGTVDGDRALTTNSTNLFDSWMATDRNHLLHLVFFGHDGFDTNSRIEYLTSSDGTTWSAPKNVLQPSDCPGGAPGCTDKPMIAIGPDPVDPLQENIYVLYVGVQGERVARSIDGGQSFEASVGLAGGAYGDAEVASDGTLHVVTTTRSLTTNPLGDVNNGIRYERSDDGGKTFSLASVEAPSELTPFYFSNPQVVYSPAQGSVHVVYPTGGPDGEWNIRLATSTDGGQSWSRITVNDDASCANHATPTIALDEVTGNLHVAWIENRGGTGSVAYAMCAPDGSSCSANEAISSAPFASYVLVRHSPRWMGEYFSLFVDPVAHALHAVWTQPVDEGGRAIARIFHSKASL